LTRYLLDTNIIGNVVRPRPSPLLLDWMAARRTTTSSSHRWRWPIRRGILE
jgi:toxin FitB